LRRGGCEANGCKDGRREEHDVRDEGVSERVAESNGDSFDTAGEFIYCALARESEP
jgi:hypothetical protein